MIEVLAASPDQKRRRRESDRPGPDGRVVIVSTVKASVAATEDHVNRNLRAGADHVVLFVDDADPEVCAHWEGSPYVTAVPTDAAYWNDGRPEMLARRQGVNANMVNLALTMVPEADWLFSLDADECLHIDRDRLLGLDESVRVVRLTTWEAASRSASDERSQQPHRYKRPLDDHELEMLVLLGALSEPVMSHYFRGHRRKIGVRPDFRLRMFLHEVENLHGRRLPMHRDPQALRVLHDESPTLDEFIRKWRAHVDGGGFHVGAKRKTIRKIFLTLSENRLATPEDLHTVHQRLYERVALDDVELLGALGFLEVRDPLQHQHTPLSFSQAQHDRMRAMLDALGSVEKSLLSHLPRARPVRALRRAQQHLASAELAEQLGASLPGGGQALSRGDGPATTTSPLASDG